MGSSFQDDLFSFGLLLELHGQTATYTAVSPAAPSATPATITLIWLAKPQGPERDGEELFGQGRAQVARGVAKVAIADAPAPHQFNLFTIGGVAYTVEEVPRRPSGSPYVVFDLVAKIP